MVYTSHYTPRLPFAPGLRAAPGDHLDLSFAETQVVGERLENPSVKGCSLCCYGMFIIFHGFFLMFHGVFQWSKQIDKDRIALNPLVDTHFPHRDCQFRGKHPFQTLFFLLPSHPTKSEVVEDFAPPTPEAMLISMDSGA